MPGQNVVIFVHQSNRMEELAAELASLVEAPLASPFSVETIVVQSRGLERWLAMLLADRFGVWANASFPFPRAFIDRILDAVAPGEPDESDRFGRESLRWAILDVLPRLIGDERLGKVRTYLEGDGERERLASFAECVAHLFDQYAVYRPELVLGWERGESRDWQAVLWRELVARLGRGHLAARAERFHRLWPDAASSEVLPERISLFGVASLPPVYVGILAALAERVPVHWFVLCASRKRGDGHPLAASLGAVQRELEQVLEARARGRTRVHTRFVAPGEDSLLHALQSDILDDVAPGTRARSHAADDDTITVHACHGPLRELEVLRDRLLAAFHSDPTLAPHDVVVMTPSIEQYAAYIDAVFAVEPDAPGHIPYRIADRSQRAQSPVAESLLAVLTVIGSRFPASEVLDLLQLEPVRSRFGLSLEEVARAEAWLAAAGVRWALDAEHRAEVGQPPVEEHTWRFALSRLLLGYAFPPDEARLFHGVLPLEAAEGKSAQALGKVAELVERLALFRERLGAPRTLRDWQAALFELLDEFVSVREENAWQLRAVRESIEGIVHAAELARHESPVERAIVVRALDQALEQELASHDFVSGAVTFCTLLPMRSVPFRMVCLLGLNDGDFPRTPRTLAFDEIARSPQPGDRDVRDEDRHSFLEALLSARERLHLSYVGRGIQDDSVRPPSVVLGELLEALDASLPAGPSRAGKSSGSPLERVADRPDERPISQRIRIEHPLMAHSRRYFDGRDPRLYSYGALELEACRALGGERVAAEPFLEGRLPEREDGRVELDDLLDLFQNPARFFAHQRLGLALDERVALIPNREPMELDALEVHALGSRLVELEIAGVPEDRAFALVRAAGLLPHGVAGRVAFAELRPDVRKIAAATLALRRGGRLEPRSFEICCGERCLTGKLGELWSSAQLVHTYGRATAQRVLTLWIRHLALCASDPGAPRSSVMISRGADGKKVTRHTLAPLEPEQSRAELARLLELFFVGHTVPLRFFPQSALEYASKLRELSGEPEAAARALRSARQVFEGRGRLRAELADPAVERLFRDVDPFASDGGRRGPSFEQLATAVFGPCLERLESQEVEA